MCSGRVLASVAGMRQHWRMRDGGDDGTGIPPLPGPAAPVDDRVLDTPNCPRCLTRMEAEEAPSGEPYWACTECGQVVLA